MNYEDYGYIKTNREKRMSPQSGEWWCDTCDAHVVAVGAKCPICRKINGSTKKVVLKKETNS